MVDQRMRLCGTVVPVVPVVPVRSPGGAAVLARRMSRQPAQRFLARAAAICAAIRGDRVGDPEARRVCTGMLPEGKMLSR